MISAWLRIFGRVLRGMLASHVMEFGVLLLPKSWHAARLAGLQALVASVSGDMKADCAELKRIAQIISARGNA